MKRNEFLRNAGLLAGSSIIFQNSIYAKSSASIKVGLIGVNGMGWSDLNAILKVENVTCTALCDVDENILDKRVEELAKRDIKVNRYIDYKDLLKDSQIDVVIIGTPDHWHCLMLVDAVKAGKHVYVEKPLGNSIKECEVMVSAAKQYNKLVQVGQWQRSQQHFRDAINFVQSGKLGKIRLVKAWAYQGWMKSIPIKPDEEAPKGVHYDKWLGPARNRPFNPNRFHFDFRWFWDYAGGLMTDWGVHMLDFALIGMKVSNPISITASGGKFAYPEDAAETPDTLTTVFQFKDFNLQWEQATGIDQGPYGKDHGVSFIGNNGTLVLNRGGWEVIAEKGRMEPIPSQLSKDNGLELHMENFVQAIRSKDKSILHAPIEAGAHIAILSQMGNVAYRTGEKLQWDAEKRNFTSNKANEYLLSSYHNGYELPKI